MRLQAYLIQQKLTQLAHHHLQGQMKCKGGIMLNRIQVPPLPELKETRNLRFLFSTGAEMRRVQFMAPATSTIEKNPENIKIVFTPCQMVLRL